MVSVYFRFLSEGPELPSADLVQFVSFSAASPSPLHALSIFPAATSFLQCFREMGSCWSTQREHDPKPKVGKSLGGKLREALTGKEDPSEFQSLRDNDGNAAEENSRLQRRLTVDEPDSAAPGVVGAGGVTLEVDTASAQRASIAALKAGERPTHQRSPGPVVNGGGGGDASAAGGDGKPGTPVNRLRRRLTVEGPNPNFDGTRRDSRPDSKEAQEAAARADPGEHLQDDEADRPICGTAIFDLGGTSVKGYAPYNPKKANQDSMVMFDDEDTGSLLLCVFDGHGEHGHFVSRHFRDMLPRGVLQHDAFAAAGGGGGGGGGGASTLHRCHQRPAHPRFQAPC